MAELQYLTVDHLTTKDLVRIFSRVSVDPSTGCWNWAGGLSTDGYGKIGFGGKNESFHRVMYAWLVGPLPRGFGRGIPTLDHFVCDNRRCGNPAHLKLVPHGLNTLRSASCLTAINARKTHCVKGHLLPAEPNRTDGGRRCLICKRAQERERLYGEGREKYLAGQRLRNRECYRRRRQRLAVK